MSFSPDGEWLAGGAADQAAHKVYIWDLSNDGQFTTALDGGREPLVDMHVSPICIFCCCLTLHFGSGTRPNLPFCQ